MNMISIKKWAQDKVANKTISQRVWHSGFFHSLRSATTSRGSAASKAAGVATAVAKGALGFIPIPIAGTLASAAVSAAESAAREHHINTMKKRAETLPEDEKLAEEAKWGIKSLTIDELDRYRKKVEMAANDVVKAIATFESTRGRFILDHKPCDAYADLALAYEQLERRVEILRNKSIALVEVGLLAQNYANQTQSQLKASYDQFNKQVASYLKATSETTASHTDFIEHHQNCSKYCFARQITDADGDGYKQFKDRLAQIATVCSSNLSVTDFASPSFDPQTKTFKYDQYQDASKG